MKVLFIDIDTLRPDHMSCYGYGRQTTPNIDVIAKEGVRFNQYYTSDAPCLPSRAALISGMFGIKTGAVGHGGTCADMRLYGKERSFTNLMDENNFNNIFRRAGMRTASISTFPERHSSWWFSAGCNETYNVGGRGIESGEQVLPVALDWLERNKAQDHWFLHVHFWDPHTPYRAPESFGSPFENEPLSTWITAKDLEKHLQQACPHGANELSMYDDGTNEKFPRQLGRISDMDDLKKVMDGYDTGIRYVDFLIGQIFDKLRENGQYDDTAVIITSDHGENMGELGIYSEHATADLPTCRIPMIIKWPGCKHNAIDNGLRYHLDLAPTIAELLDVQRCDHWDGISYTKALTAEDGGREYLVLSQMAHVCQRSARFGDWLYMRTYHDGYHLFDKEMLYNIKEDPYEQNDVKEQYPDICAKGAKYILDWHDEMMLQSGSEIDPMLTVLKEGGPFHTRGHLSGYIKRLNETGRSEAAALLRQKYPGEL